MDIEKMQENAKKGNSVLKEIFEEIEKDELLSQNKELQEIGKKVKETEKKFNEEIDN